MRVRAMTGAGDMQFGQGGSNFLANSPAAVAQLIGTRLGLWVGEWFLDTSAGTGWMQRVIGRGTSPTYDAEIREAILLTPGVLGILSYNSAYASSNRTLTVSATVETIYGVTTVSSVLIV